ncbi:MAG: hypothetical protein VKJ66_08545 [Synechococcus sp.]|nr:hypothetical protein [Synechococcus sp.]
MIAAGGKDLSSHYVRIYQKSIQGSDFASARSLLFAWINDFFAALPVPPARQHLRDSRLWHCLANYASLSADRSLVELFWSRVEAVVPTLGAPVAAWPVLGIPVVNRPDLLERLLLSLDAPVQTLALVDNGSGGAHPDAAALASLLQNLQVDPPTGVAQVRVARPFGNLGVAASWNQVLTGFPQAPFTLLVNNDVVFAPGVLQEALACLNPARAQFLPLLPPPQEFSAFALTALAWDRVGLFDESFYPAYCEDLDYADRLRQCPEVEWLHCPDLQKRMQALNPDHSATIRSDAVLEGYNRFSYPLNCLWYFSERRHRGERRGVWRRRWLAEWATDSPA